LLKTTLLIDLDGTLTDPWPGISRCIGYALKQMGLPVPGTQALRKWIGPPLLQSFADWFAETGGGDPEHAVTLYRERFASKGLFENHVYPGIPEMLAELFDAGYGMMLATAKPTVFAKQIVQHFGFDQWLTAIYGAGLDGRLSDKTELLAHIIEQENLDPAHCFMLGDREYDMRAARYHGIKAVGVTWGFGSVSELHDSGAQWLIDTPGGMSRVLQEAGFAS
jgi:phosphoglycolate phosphatase